VGKFVNIMKQRSNAELLEITTTLRNDYQPEALVAAEHELNSRNLTEEETGIAQNELHIKKLEEEKKKEKVKQVEEKVASISDLFHPMTYKSTDSIIKGITIGLLILYLINFISSWSLTKMTLLNVEYWDFTTVIHFVPLILFPIGLFGFWKLKKFGWTILTILITTSTVAALFSTLHGIKRMLEEDKQHFSSNFNIEFSMPEYGMGKFSSQLVQFIVIGGILYYIYTPRISERFEIRNRSRLIVVGLTAALNAIFWLALYF